MDFYDLLQDGVRLEQTQAMYRETSRLSDEAKRLQNVQDDRFLQLTQQIDRLALVTQALWEVLRDRGGVTSEEFKEKILEIDMRDGKKDNHMGHVAQKCPNCDSMVCVKLNRCLFCGFVPEKGDHDSIMDS